MANSGWTKEFPRAEGFYWARRTQTNRPEPRIIQVWEYEGDWYAYRHGDGRDIEAADFSKSLYEFLGPILHSDFEQLTRLRAAAENAVELIALGLHRSASARLCEALAPKKGEQS